MCSMEEISEPTLQLGTKSPEKEASFLSKKKRVSPFEQKIQEMFERRKEGEPRINVDIFYGYHRKQKDIEAVRKQFTECNIYIPEAAGWSEEDIKLYRSVSSGAMPEQEFERYKTRLKPHIRSEVEMLYNSKKPIVLIDIPKVHRLYKELLMYDLSIQKEFQNPGSFEQLLQFTKSHIKKVSTFQREREEYMLSHLKPAVDQILKEYPDLKRKEVVRVLLRLGATHTPFYHILKKGLGEGVQEHFQETPMVFLFVDEARRRYQLNKEVNDQLIAKALVESWINPARIIDTLPSSQINKKFIFLRKFIDQLDDNDIKEIYETRYQKPNIFPELVLHKMKEKGFQFPKTEQELDKMIGWKGRKK